MSYVQSFSKDAREIFEHFHFDDFVQQLTAANLLYQVVQRFASVDLSPKRISNFGMGIIFEELIRKFAESSNETAGEHFTPRDIVHLTTSLVITGQDKKLKPSSIVTIYDPTAGTGGFLSEGDEYIQEISKKVTVTLFGQELNPESYAICKADMLIKGQDVGNIKLGNTLSDDQLKGKTFDFMLSNPPFGVEWKKVQKQVTDEHNEKGFDGRFGPGLPRVSDGSLLFLLHLVSKMRDPRDGGSRIGIILNGSPLFTGGAGSGESEIRRYLLQHDMVEAIVALPTDMFYNTGIATYVWLLSNNKPKERKGKVQLIDGTGHFTKMRKSLGSKRQYINDEQIDELVRLYGQFKETPLSKIFPVEAFGYRRITVERPLRDAKGKVVLSTKGKTKGQVEADSNLRDNENVPLGESVYEYFEREVKPHVPDAWIDESKCDELDGEVGIVGFEIPFNRHFYVFKPPRPLEEIDRDLKACTDRIKQMIEDLSA
jgi:type I restriction enzyme M protein